MFPRTEMQHDREHVQTLHESLKERSWELTLKALEAYVNPSFSVLNIFFLIILPNETLQCSNICWIFRAQVSKLCATLTAVP